MGPSLAEVARLVERTGGVRELSLVVFSDFELFDPNLDGLLTDLARFLDKSTPSCSAGTRHRGSTPRSP